MKADYLMDVGHLHALVPLINRLINSSLSVHALCLLSLGPGIFPSLFPSTRASRLVLGQYQPSWRHACSL